MEIIRYFCIVKRFNCFLRTLCLAVFAFLTANLHAGNSNQRQQPMDSVEISLLTCSPGIEVWSLYGHTAIRLQDFRTNEDIVINYGLFNFEQDHFILRFVFGITDYQMGIVPYQMFLMEYARHGRGVVQQRLNLSDEDKTAIVQALSENYLPQNRIYRYNYFYDNCTLRARDILIGKISGRVEYAVNTAVECSYREMIRQWTENHRWARFGNDLLLGVKADVKTGFVQRQFLPDSLRKDFAEAMVVEQGGRKHALVDSTFQILRVSKANAIQFPTIWDVISPTALFVSLLAVVMILSYIEIRRKKIFWLLDVVLLTLDGLAGLVLLAMVFSQHPTVSLNLQILLLNPLSIVFVYPTVSQGVRKKYYGYWTVLAVCIILFAIGAFFQDYAEGIWILALILFCRISVNYRINKQSHADE